MRTRSPGFSLLELMIVLVIVSVLAALLLTNLSSSKGRGTQAKAQALLGEIQLAQERYRSQVGGYWAGMDLAGLTGFGLKLDPALMGVYTFANAVDMSGNGFMVIASGNLDSDATIDSWRIDQTGTLVNLSDDVRD